MKTYCYYSESSYKGMWDYYKNKFKYPSLKELTNARTNSKHIDTGNIHIEYFSFCYKKQMINIVGERINSKNWVRERISLGAGSKEVIELCNKHKGFIIVREDRTNEIIELIPLEKETIK